MHPVVTNNDLRAYDAYNNTFEQPGDLTSLTNTQRLSHHRLIYNAFAEVRVHTQIKFITIICREKMMNKSQQFAAFIGLDWADQKHDICLKANNCNDLEYSVIDHSPESIEQWALDLQARFKNKPIAICLELKAGPIVYALLKYSFFVLFPIPPKALARYRETFTQSGAKDDPTDAFLQLDFLLRHPESLRRLAPDSEHTRILQRFTEDRRDLVDDKVRLTNRIRAALKSYFPQALQWFDDIDTHLFCDFMLKWPNLSKAQRARKTTLSAFFKAHNCARAKVIEQRLAAIKTALPLTLDEGVIVSHEKLVVALCAQLKPLLDSIKDYDRDIAKRFLQHGDYEIFDSLPGAGPVYGPRLLSAFGSNRERFESAKEVQQLSGVAPVMERSGQKQWIHWRYSCSKFIRQTFVEWARQSLKKSYWARNYYDEKRKQGKSHQATLRALAFKWIRIIFRCWKTKTPYDESKYLFALKKRSPQGVQGV